MESIVNEALHKGVEMHVAGEFEFASQLYGSVIKLQPNHADANHNMGLLKVDTGNEQEALPYLQTALEADTSIAQFWLSYITVLIKLDRIDEATRILNLAKESGVGGDALLELHQQLNVPTTIDVIDHSGDDAASPAKPNILDNLKLDKALRLAKRKFKDGSSDEAKLIYQDILSRFPKNKKAADGIKALSGVAISEASEVQEPPQNMLQFLINLYTQGQFQQALEQANKLLQQFPKSVDLYNIQGASNAGLQQLGAAEESYKRAIEIKPEFSDAYNNLAAALQGQGKLEEAIKTFKKALSIKPDYAEAHNNMGVALKEQDKLEEAVEAYTKAISVKPEYAEAYNNTTELLKLYTPIKQNIHPIFQINRTIKKIGKKLAVVISDEELVENLFQAIDTISFESFNFETSLSQIFKRNSTDLNCDRHTKIFDTKNIIPEFCLSDFHIIRKWIDYAKGLQDPSCEKFKDTPIIYHDIYETAILRKSKLNKIF